MTCSDADASTLSTRFDVQIWTSPTTESCGSTPERKSKYSKEESAGSSAELKAALDAAQEDLQWKSDEVTQLNAKVARLEQAINELM